MHQYLFFIGDFPVRAYGLLLSLGIISAAIVAYYLFKRDGRGWHVHIVDFSILVGIAGIIGARLWDVFFFDWAYYHNHLLEIPFVWQGGMAIQGGVVLGTIAGFWYTRKHGIDSLAFADIFAPALILGQSVGRMANLMNGDAFGHPTGGNFGILYPETTLAYRTYGAQPLWPAEIWEGQIDILIFVFLLLFSTKRHKKGQVFVLYAILYSAARFGLEFLRGDYVDLTMGLKSAQMTSLIVIAIGIVLFIYLQIKGSYDEYLIASHEAAEEAAKNGFTGRSKHSATASTTASSTTSNKPTGANNTNKITSKSSKRRK
nr:prolipoprotein diacylglyceryl transferase [uncultured Veillonella sp.]